MRDYWGKVIIGKPDLLPADISGVSIFDQKSQTFRAVVYVIACMAGFAYCRAEVVAYCSQYVDDATNSGTIVFDYKAMFQRTSALPGFAMRSMISP